MNKWFDFTCRHLRTAVSRWFRLFQGHSKRGDKILPVEFLDRYRKAVISTATSIRSFCKPSLVTWAESFIFAGSSALLLHLVNLFPEYWYVSFFALTPFLYRIIKASPMESLRLGFLFGLSFFAVSLVDSPIAFSHPSLFKLVSGTALFALFGWTVGWARHRWGFYPCIVALLWVGLEMGLVKLGMNQNGSYLGFVGGPLGKAEFSHPFFHSLVALFGFITVSAVIVLLNSLLALVIVRTLEVTKPKRKTVQEDERVLDLPSIPGLLAQKIYLVPEGRAPPLVPKAVCMSLRM